jgi:hypothetical protein
MTIMVMISNEETSAGRSIKVTEVEINKTSGQHRDTNPLVIAPGERRSFYIHQLKDLRVEEINPDGR